MFYCSKCALERDWPQSIFCSYGKCEICGETAECNDVQSSKLPLPVTISESTFVDGAVKVIESQLLGKDYYDTTDCLAGHIQVLLDEIERLKEVK